MEPDFQQAMRESEEAFAKQFDPTSTTFHHGDPTPVPVWTDRIPDSMPTAYDKEYIDKSKQNENVSYGIEYERLTDLRNLFMDLKKILNQICPPIEAVLRIKAKTMENEKKEKMMETEMKKVEQVTNEVKKNIEILQKTSYADKYVDVLENICKDAFRNFKDKEDYTNYLFQVKNITAKCFAEANDILDKIKKVKASYKPS